MVEYDHGGPGSYRWLRRWLAGIDAQRLRQAQASSLARLRFVGADGQWLRGDQLQVLRPGRMLAPAQWPLRLEEVLWYCEGPDGQGYVAIPVNYRIGWGWRVEWEIRPGRRQGAGLVLRPTG